MESLVEEFRQRLSPDISYEKMEHFILFMGLKVSRYLNTGQERYPMVAGFARAVNEDFGVEATDLIVKLVCGIANSRGIFIDQQKLMEESKQFNQEMLDNERLTGGDNGSN